MKLIQPPNTGVYNVTGSDTLASIALRFNTTPTELSRLNHLASSLLFPGQTLFVPGKKENVDEDDIATVKLLKANHSMVNASITNKELSSCSPQKVVAKTSMKLSNLERSFSPDHNLDKLLDKKDLHSSPDEVSQKYLKVTARYITDGQGVVSGILLVTPQTLMFNPNVSDHLVMDRGRDFYIVRAPLKSIAKAIFYDDIAAMVTEDVEKRHTPSSSFINYEASTSPKPGVIICQQTGEAYSLKQSHNTEKLTEELENLKNKIAQLESSKEITDLNCEKSERLDDLSTDEGISTISENHSTEMTMKNDILEKGNDIVNTNNEHLNSQHEHDSSFMSDQKSSSTPKHLLSKDKTCNIKETSKENYINEKSKSESNTIEINIENVDNDKDSTDDTIGFNNDISPLSNEEDKHEHLTKTSHLSHSYDCSKDSGISDVTNYSCQDSQEIVNEHIPLGGRSTLSDEARQWLGKRGINISSDIANDDDSKSATESEQTVKIQNRPEKMSDPLMYLAIKIHKRYWLPSRTKTNAIMGIPPNRDQKRRQHWFAFPEERLDQLYSFLLQWAPDVNEFHSGVSTPCSEENVLEKSAESGVNIVEETFRNSPASTFGYDKLRQAELSTLKPSYEENSLSNVSLSSRSSLRSLVDDEPDLLAESDILSKKQISQLSRKLPSRTVGHSWDLVYSTMIHGISLSTLYRNFQGYDSPVLMIVKDEHHKIFGAFISESPKVSESFYGTGESLLFSFKNESKIKIYQWSGENNFFMKGSKTSFAIGGGEGVFGLWLDEDLYRGRSHSCRTFENETLSECEDFRCTGLEAWAFV